jgi:hypothetical protein
MSPSTARDSNSIDLSMKIWRWVRSLRCGRHDVDVSMYAFRGSPPSAMLSKHNFRRCATGDSVAQPRITPKSSCGPLYTSRYGTELEVVDMNRSKYWLYCVVGYWSRRRYNLKLRSAWVLDKIIDTCGSVA